MSTVPLRRTLLFIALSVTLQVGLLACGGSPSGESTESSVHSEAAAHLTKAQQLLREDDLRSALAHTDTAATIDSSAADIYFLRGRVFTQLSQYEEAESAYERALSLDPDRQGAWFNIGNNYFRRQKFRKALNYYVKEEEKHPTPSLYVHMAQSYSNLGKIDSSIHAYEQALAMDSTYAPAHAWLGQLYQDEGQYEKALDYTERALSLDSANVKYRFFLGHLLLNTGQPKAAVEHLRRVAREQPWHYAAYYNLGQAYARLGRQEMAEKYLAQADTLQKTQAKIARLQTMARQESNQPQHWVELAGALQDVGRLEQAREAYGVALSLAPGNVAIQNNLANVALALGDTSDAVERYRDILRKDSSYVGVWLNLGVVYVQMGRDQQAIDAWKQALHHDPDNPTAKAYLAKLTGQ